MNNQNLPQNPQINWKYILIVVILALLVGGFTIWQYIEMQKEETELPEIKIPEKQEKKEEIRGEGTANWKTGGLFFSKIDYPSSWEELEGLDAPVVVYATTTDGDILAAIAVQYHHDIRYRGANDLSSRMEKAFTCVNKKTVKIGKSTMIRCGWVENIERDPTLELSDIGLGQMEEFDYSHAHVYYPLYPSPDNPDEGSGFSIFYIVDSLSERKEEFRSLSDEIFSTFRFLE